jgi:hypothetical protein
MQEWPTRQDKKKVMHRPVGLPPTHPDMHVFGVRGLTQTDRFRPFQTPKWAGPLEMPLDHPIRVP